MEFIFWISALVIGYVYVGYPLLLAAFARVWGQPPRKAAFASGAWPAVSVIVAARNEAAQLPARLRNLLDAQYPGPFEIIVVSDGSTDDTAAVLQPYVSRGMRLPFTGRNTWLPPLRGSVDTAVRFIEVPANGKPLALNAGVDAARGEILVFADARQRFDGRALRELVANFSDPRVGGATGELVLDCERGETASPVGEGVGLYWKYEKWMRSNESKLRSTLGATGAIYALRRALWQPLPAETLLDDVLAPMRAVLSGFRIVFDPAAVAYDAAAPDARTEARRKTRTLAGNYQILLQEPRLLLPVVNPVWPQYVSHKIGRLVVPWALLGLLVASIALARESWVYTTALVLQLGFYGLAIAGALTAVTTGMRRVPRVAHTFVVMNYSAIAGLFALRHGRQVWK